MPDWQEGYIGDWTPLADRLSPLIEARILQFIVDGVDSWKSWGFNRFGDQENHFTAALTGWLREVRRRQGLSFDVVREQTEDDRDTVAGRADPNRASRIDIAIWWGPLSEEAYFTVECKRLGSGRLSQRYVTEGMMRFIDGRYARTLPSAAMLGYVIQGDIATVWEEVNRRVEQYHGLSSSDMLRPRAPIGVLSTAYESRHKRQAGAAEFRITHLFVDMVSLPQLK